MRRLLLTLAVLLPTLVVVGAPAWATPEPNNQPNHSEAELLDKLNQTAMPDGTIRGFVHVQDPKAAVLIQPNGRIFEYFHAGTQRWIDGGMVVVAVLAMAALYFFAGTMDYKPDPRGRTMQRFTVFERFVHWLTASTFILLGLTGLNLVLGRVLLQPLIGDHAFYELTLYGKLSHNFFGFAFIVGLALMLVQWLKDNLPARADIAWFKALGGMFGGEHPAAWKFNAGQKMIYWAAFWGGGLICLTGVGLIFPFYLTGILGMQIMQVLHSTVAAIMIAIVIGHIYLGSLGVKGSFSAMSRGRVDVNWAQTHHPLWVHQEIARHRIDPDVAAGGMHPAE
jgi:formate dehydrogenase subunit gamma